MKTIKAQVHMLPTEEPSLLAINNGDIRYANFNLSPGATLLYQHFYITTEEEIKEGDWFYYNHNGGVIGQYKKGMGEIDGKIIATTAELTPNGTTEFGAEQDILMMPQIPQSFIEEYCKAGGIDEILVEVELHTFRNGKPWSTDWKLKLNYNNEIVIHPVEERMIPLSKASKAIHEAIAYARLPMNMLNSEQIDKWIEENL